MVDNSPAKDSTSAVVKAEKLTRMEKKSERVLESETAGKKDGLLPHPLIITTLKKSCAASIKPNEDVNV